MNTTKEIHCTFTFPELLNIASLGVMRHVQNIKNGRKDRYGASKKDGWQLHIDGVCGEAAVAKTLKLYYNGSIGDLSACDVHGRDVNIEVRTTPHRGNSLILHPKDKDENLFVLVIGNPPHFTLKGWLTAKEGKKEEFWRDPTGEGRPAFFVPQHVLNPMSTFIGCFVDQTQQV